MKRKEFLLDRMRLTFLAAVLVLLVAVVGCTADTDEGEPGAVDTPTEEVAQISEQAQNYIDLSRQALAEQLGVDESAVELESITEPAVEDDTYIIILTYEGETFEYHGRNNEVMLVSEPLPTAPEMTEPAPPTEEEVTYSYDLAQVEEVTVMVDLNADEPVKVRINGQLRSGCEELYEHSVEMRDDTTFAVELTARRPEGVACTMILKAYETTVPLAGIADFPAGEYTVVVNDEVTTTFVWPGMAGEEANIPSVDVTVDETIFTGIMTTTVPEVEGAEGLPFWEILPAHTAITLDGYIQSDSLHGARMWVYPVEALTAVNEAAFIEVDSLRQVLDTQPDLASAESLPYLPLSNAAQAFHAQAEYLDFESGRGIRYLTQYGQAVNPITNQELVYTFQGLTEDGAYYIAAVLPLSHPDLPDSTEAAPEEFDDDFEAYLAGIVEMLNQADAASFIPDLAALDATMASITVGAAMGAGENGTAVHSEADLVFRLEEAGAEVALSTEPIAAADILSIPGNTIFVNGEELQLYNYDTAEAAMSDAERISADGFEIGPAEGSDAGPSIVDWTGQPHFYRWDNIIILYIGEDSDMLALLSEVLGDPFAG